ncbi:DUF2986 domain-containing protein [Pseudomonas sp.]|uniref:DUF2986 domain-containing protein n=1 Tax=Pseudomonas sp. TaxID=306 RepID=UPI003C782248
MNRRKKIKQLLEAHAKKANAKLAPKKKSTYISKADRLKLASETSQDPITSSAPTGSDVITPTKNAPQP